MCQNAICSDGREPALLDVLVAAYAETGQFSQAIQIANQGLGLADSQHNDALAAALRQRIELYRVDSPYRESDR